MKKLSFIISAAVLTAALTGATTVRANNNSLTQTLDGHDIARGAERFPGFSDTEQAKGLRRAYVILATGDHDYSGHRVGAMQQVRAAAELLGMDVAGDANVGQPQPLSDDKMREAKGLIVQVLDAAQVKGQKDIIKHLNEALHQINVALGIK